MEFQEGEERKPHRALDGQDIEEGAKTLGNVRLRASADTDYTVRVTLSKSVVCSSTPGRRKNVLGMPASSVPAMFE